MQVIAQADSGNDLFTNVLVSLVAAFIVFVIGAVTGAIWQRLLRRRALRQLFDLSKDRPIRIVFGSPIDIDPGTDQPTTEHAVPLLSLGTVFAFQWVQARLAHAYPKQAVRFYTAENFPADFLGDNLVLIGFPQTNTVTKLLLQRVQPPVVFNGHQLVSTTSGQTWEADLDGHRITADIGYLLHTRNPFNKTAAAIVIAGSQSYGMKAAAEYLSTENLLELSNRTAPRPVRWVLRRLPFLIRQRKRARNYLAIVGTDVNDYYTSAPWLLHYAELP